MILCPVCEHSQPAAGECAQCGAWVGPRPAAAPVVVAPMAEVERTELAGAKAAVSVDRMIDLDATRLASGPDLPTEAVPELERTRAAAVGAVAPQPIAELERGRNEDNGPRTAVSAGPVVCRYCKTPQGEGAICERCGMRLPRVAKAAAPGVAGKKSGPAESTRCRACGAPAKVGARCGDCGREVPAPEP
jgi:hypothetical protein